MLLIKCSCLTVKSVWPFYTGCWRRPCGTTHGFESTKGRRKSGTVQVCSPLVASTLSRQGASPPVVVWRGDQSLPTSEHPFEQDLGSARFAVCMASLALLRRSQGELFVAGSPSVTVRNVCDSALFLGVELPSPVAGYPWHPRDVGQSRAVPDKRRVGTR